MQNKLEDYKYVHIHVSVGKNLTHSSFSMSLTILMLKKISVSNSHLAMITKKVVSKRKISLTPNSRMQTKY